MARQIDDKQDTVTFRAVSHDETGMKRVTKTEVESHNIDTLKHHEKKLRDKGLHRMDRHPVDGVGVNHPPHKAGHGGRFTWKDPGDFVNDEMEPVPAAIDEWDPNYVDEEAEEGRILSPETSDVAGFVVGEVEVPKMADTGVARVDVDTQLMQQM